MPYSQRLNPNQYRSLNDAQVYDSAYAPGTRARIWYLRDDAPLGFRFGYERALADAPDWIPRSPAALPATHVLIGSMAAERLDLEDIFRLMQGEFWSPAGEAWTLIANSGAGHTSMSVGDIIELDNRLYFVDNDGFQVLSAGPASQSNRSGNHVAK